MQAHSYKPDFSISWTGLAAGLFIPERCAKWAPPLFFINHDARSYVDIKPGYEAQESRTAVFRVNQKWVWSRYGIFVQPVVVLPDSAGKPKHSLFPATFTPQRVRWTDSGRQGRKINFPARDLDEFIGDRGPVF